MRYLSDEKIISALRCPVCGSEMAVDVKSSASLFCRGVKKHCYDFSSRGYVNFAPPGHTSGGDSKQAVLARTGFLDLELYRPVAQKLSEIIDKYCGNNGAFIIDAGCGEGYYSTALAEKGYSVFGVDLSKFAVDGACKRANSGNLSNSFFAVSSVYNLPVADRSAQAVVNVFAPCVEEEYSRVLSDDGILAVVYAGEKHLLGLKKAVYDVAHENDGRDDLPVGLALAEEVSVEYDIELCSNGDIKNLFAMTPYYWKTSKEDHEKLETLSYLKTEVHMVIGIYRKAGEKKA